MLCRAWAFRSTVRISWLQYVAAVITCRNSLIDLSSEMHFQSSVLPEQLECLQAQLGSPACCISDLTACVAYCLCCSCGKSRAARLHCAASDVRSTPLYLADQIIAINRHFWQATSQLIVHVLIREQVEGDPISKVYHLQSQLSHLPAHNCTLHKGRQCTPLGIPGTD